MIEFTLGTLVGVLLGAAVVGVILAGTSRDRELEAFRNGYRRGLEDTHE